MDPLILVALNPAPNSIPFTPGIANIIFAISPSNVSKNGSPTPTGNPSVRHRTIPPTLSPSSLAVNISFSMSSAISGSAA